jgi:double-stranded uracil-DNA glycosylase
MGASREYGLPPILGKDPVVLILGSFPSKMSLERHHYYANPQNQFWRMMADLLNSGSVKDGPSLPDLLKDRHIAVWDVIGSRRYQQGSMDRDIVDPLLNDIPGFIGDHPSIRYVGLNGGTAWVFFQRSLRGTPFPGSFVSEQLPSTSPAYASCPYPQKLERWQHLLEYLE